MGSSLFDSSRHWSRLCFSKICTLFKLCCALCGYMCDQILSMFIRIASLTLGQFTIRNNRAITRRINPRQYGYVYHIHPHRAYNKSKYCHCATSDDTFTSWQLCFQWTRARQRRVYSSCDLSDIWRYDNGDSHQHWQETTTYSITKDALKLPNIRQACNHGELGYHDIYKYKTDL